MAMLRLLKALPLSLGLKFFSVDLNAGFETSKETREDCGGFAKGM
jgi:hypothetical protein